jgi:hypothetical protein
LARAVTRSIFLVAGAVLVAMGCGRESDDEATVDAADAVSRGDAIAESARDTLVDAFYEWPTPPTSLDYVPVCGTDGVTYWNDEQATAKGVLSTSGACSGDRWSCGPGSVKPPCPAGTVCIGDYIAITPTYCTMTGDWYGQCWFIPLGAKCPSTDTPSSFDCATSTCATFCDVVRDVHSYRMDKACP